jgi:hypothetical protein
LRQDKTFAFSLIKKKSVQLINRNWAKIDTIWQSPHEHNQCQAQTPPIQDEMTSTQSRRQDAVSAMEEANTGRSNKEEEVNTPTHCQR